MEQLNLLILWFFYKQPDFHDGVIVKARYKSGFLHSVFDKCNVGVVVLTYEDRLFAIHFSKVRSASIINADGMRLYSLSEMQATPPFRRFVFVNSEEKKSNRHCEVVAREIAMTEMTEEFSESGNSAPTQPLSQAALTINAGFMGLEEFNLPSS